MVVFQDAEAHPLPAGDIFGRFDIVGMVRYFADKVFLSPGYFGDLVKKETGKTAQEYIQGKIIELSKEYILGSQLGISQIAYSLGFQYPQHFSRLFKKLEGCTPNEFRNQAMS